jgi:succinoglycan biosynthesis protein ExoU
VVVDDASTDSTVDAARAADDGSGRLEVVAQPANAGPAAARNRAIALSTAPVIAILDADDRFVPGRLGTLLAVPDWDIVADDILFVPEATGLERAGRSLPAPPVPDRGRAIDLATFVRGNITRRGRRRGELGFLHPLLRRAFLEDAGLAYDETMRLGEDYDLYARALAAGARFRIVHTVGYLALERPGSLSGAHGTGDLERLVAADTRLLADPHISAQEAAALSAHRRDTMRRHRLRTFLDARRARGLAGAAVHLLGRPAETLDVVRGVVSDKWASLFPSEASADRLPRTLLAATAPSDILRKRRQ